MDGYYKTTWKVICYGLRLTYCLVVHQHLGSISALFHTIADIPVTCTLRRHGLGKSDVINPRFGAN